MIKDLPEYMKYLQFFNFFSDADGLKKSERAFVTILKNIFL